MVRLNNIELREIHHMQDISLNNCVRIIPFEVPHRGEFSETVGFTIKGSSKSIIYLPGTNFRIHNNIDVDAWNISSWTFDIREMISGVQRAYIDGCFYDINELQRLTGRQDVKDIPHPTIEQVR